MKKQIAAVIAAGAGFCWGYYGPVQTVRSEHVPSTVASDMPQSINETDERLANYTEWLAILTAGLVIAGVFQAYLLRRSVKDAKDAAAAQSDANLREYTVAYTAASAATRSAETASDTAQRELRAYVGVESLCLRLNPSVVLSDSSPDEPGYIFRDFVEVMSRNVGKTPAVGVRVWTYWAETPFPTLLPQDFGFPIGPVENPLLYTSTFVLFPGQSYTSRIAIRDTGPFMRAYDRSSNIFVFGRIDYSDVFGKLRQTRFCQQFQPHAANTDFEFVAYDKHNDAT